MSQPTKYPETIEAAKTLGNSFLSDNGLIAETTFFLEELDRQFFKARHSNDACERVLQGIHDALEIRLGEGKWPEEWPL